MAEAEHDSGQAMVETAIVVPLMLFIFMCLFQLMLIAHARVLTEYAAFAACRAGVVQNGNTYIMSNAALLAVLPALPSPPFLHQGRITDWQTFLAAWGVWQVAEAPGLVVDSLLGQISVAINNLFGVNIGNIAPDVAITSVQVLNPKPSDFTTANGPDGKEIDFDLPNRTNTTSDNSLNATEANRLTIQVQFLYPLTVPFANRLIFDLWMVYRFIGPGGVPTTEPWLSPKGGTLDQTVQAAPITTGLSQGAIAMETFQALRLLAGLSTPIYLLPLTASSTMPMESNIFKNFVQPGGGVPW